MKKVLGSLFSGVVASAMTLGMPSAAQADGHEGETGADRHAQGVGRDLVPLGLVGRHSAGDVNENASQELFVRADL